MAAYEFWAQRDGADYLKLSVPSDSTPTIDWTADAQIKASAALQCVYDARISWLTDDLAIYRVAGGVRECLGVFCVTTSPISTDESGVQIQSLTGYDQTYVLVELSRLEYTHTVRAGTGYMDAIREQLIAAGIHQMMLTDCPDTVATDMAWEPGTSRYDIISQLLSDINYRDLWFNGSGCAICEPWAPAAITPATHTYDASAASGMLVEMEQDCDTFSAANVFVSIVSSADIAGEMRAESVNDDISSPLSVQRRGLRIPVVETLDSIASQDALQARANMNKLHSMMSTELYTFYTSADTERAHGLNDAILLQRDGVGLLEEQDWSLECAPGGTMTHTGRRVYYNLDS